MSVAADHVRCLHVPGEGQPALLLAVVVQRLGPEHVAHGAPSNGHRPLGAVPDVVPRLPGAPGPGAPVAVVLRPPVGLPTGARRGHSLIHTLAELHELEGRTQEETTGLSPRGEPNASHLDFVILEQWVV